jgi:hypothetical protein
VASPLGKLGAAAAERRHVRGRLLLRDSAGNDGGYDPLELALDLSQLGSDHAALVAAGGDLALASSL